MKKKFETSSIKTSDSSTFNTFRVSSSLARVFFSCFYITLNWIKREHPHFVQVLIVTNLKYVFITHKIIYGSQDSGEEQRHDKEKYKHHGLEKKKKLALEMSNIDINGQQFINCTFYDDV